VLVPEGLEYEYRKRGPSDRTASNLIFVLGDLIESGFAGLVVCTGRIGELALGLTLLRHGGLDPTLSDNPHASELPANYNLLALGTDKMLRGLLDGHVLRLVETEGRLFIPRISELLVLVDLHILRVHPGRRNISGGRLADNLIRAVHNGDLREPGALKGRKDFVGRHFGFKPVERPSKILK